MSTQSPIQAVQPSSAMRRLFTLDQANEALPYVSKVVEDVRSAYRRAVHLRRRLDHNIPADDVQLVTEDYEQTITRLDRFVDELQEVGVELKDYELGLIDFPAMHDGREICLCWKCGEGHIEAWHETDAGFAGRQDLGKLCDSCGK